MNLKPTERPVIRKDGALWECRGTRGPVGYGHKPDGALREWLLMNVYAGKPAGAAQEARPMQPLAVASVSTVENRHVSDPA